MTTKEYEREVIRTTDHSLDHRNMMIDAALCLAGEAGEVVELIKKWAYRGHELDRTHVLEELSDVAWALTRLSLGYGFTLDQIMEANAEKMRIRYPEGFTKEDSIRRADHG